MRLRIDTTTKNMNKSQMAALIEHHWDDIVLEVGTQNGPSLWSLTRRDGLKPIPDTPENVAKALMSTPPKKPGEWRCAKDRDGDA